MNDLKVPTVDNKLCNPSKKYKFGLITIQR